MTTAQKIIKYFAIAFAIFLIANIITAILGVFYGIGGVFNLKNNDKAKPENTINTNFENADVASLNIEIGYANLKIKTGDYLRVETNDKNINCRQDKQMIQITENNHDYLSKDNNKELIVYVPENLEFERVSISTGAGLVDIEKLITKNLTLELGAGETIISNLSVSSKTSIEGGVGKLSVLSGNLNDLDLSIGIGKMDISASLKGNNKINCGIGKLDINLNDGKENYKIDVDKGIGPATINGVKVIESEIYGNGETYIKVDGGIGEININFNQTKLTRLYVKVK